MIIPPGFGHVVLKFTGAAVPQGAATTFGIELQGSQFLLPRAEDIQGLFIDTFDQLISSSVSGVSAFIKAGPTVEGPSVETSSLGGFAASGNTAPPNVSYIATKRTGLGGRANRGRMYIPGVPESFAGPDGVLVSPFDVDFEVACTAFLSALAVIDSPMVLLHSASSDPTPVTGLVGQTTLATQRRRLR